MTSISSYPARPHPHQANLEWTHARFERSVDIVQSLPRSGPIQTNYDDKLLLYSVYKQATEGDIATSRPGLLDVLGRAKWDAWNKRKGLPCETAERMYVDALLKILRSFSDRTQAQVLIQELENFTLHTRGGRTAHSHTESTASTSTSTEEDRARYQQARSSAPLHHSSHSQRHRQPAPPSSAGRRAPPHVSGSASLAPPSLPGYGPPRTQPDTPRRVGARKSRRDAGRAEYSSETGSSSEEDSRRRPKAGSSRLEPLSRSGTTTVRQGPVGRQQPFTGYPAAAMSPGAHSFRAGGPSTAPSVVGVSAGMRQAVQVAYPLGGVGAPLASGSGLLPAVEPVRTAAAAVSEAHPALATALDRVQTSLTALHERLASVERTAVTSTSAATSALANPTALPTLLRLLFLRALAQLNVRQLTAGEQAGPSSGALVARLLGLAVRAARRAMGDAMVVVVVVGILARLTGRRDALGEVVLRSLVRVVGPPPPRGEGGA